METAITVSTPGKTKTIEWKNDVVYDISLLPVGFDAGQTGRYANKRTTKHKGNIEI